MTAEALSSSLCMACQTASTASHEQDLTTLGLGLGLRLTSAALGSAAHLERFINCCGNVMSAGASNWCEMVQLKPVATTATFFDRDNAIEDANAIAIEATAQRLGRLSVPRRPDRRRRCGRQDRNCVRRGSSHRKSRLSSDCNFPTSWSQRCSRRASEAITPSALSPPDMPQ